MHILFSILLSLYLSFNLSSGSNLILTDGSSWDIAPDDQNTAAFWITPAEISIDKSNDNNYPYLLSNLQTKQSVKAKKS